MITTISRFLATAITLALALGGLAVLGPITITVGMVLLACAGWALAYFGDDLAPIFGLESRPATSPYIDRLVRGVGWLFLLAAFGLFLARVLGVG